MTERVGIQYDIQGAEQGAADVARLKGSVDALDQSLGQSTTAVRAFEQTAQEAHAAAAAAATGTDNLGSSARNVASHVQGLAGLVANLAGQLGGSGSGLAGGAHLAGALAGVAAQSLALGTTLGPGGAVVGAVTGLVPLFMEWADSSDAAAAATDGLTSAQHRFELQAAGSLTAIDRLIQGQRQLANEQSRRDRIDQGLGSVDEQFAAAELAGRRVGDLRVALANVAQQIAREDAENAGHSALLEERRVQLQHEVNAALTETHRLQQLAVEADDDERQIATDILELDQEDAAARAQAAQHSRASADARRAEAEAARAQRELEQLALHGSGDGAEGVRGIAGSILAQAQARDDAAGQTRKDNEVAKQQRIEEARRAEITKTHTLEERQQAERTTKENAYHQLRTQHEQEFQSAMQATGQQIGGAFGDAYEAAINGQENFGAALLRGSKEQLAQLGTKYIAEGAGALFEAIGFAFTNPPAAGAKAIEGGGKIALGVSLGAVGSAIQPPPAPGAGTTTKAASPPTNGSSSQHGSQAPAPVVVNINAPSVLGGSDQQWGRSAARSISQAQLRYRRAV